MQNSALCSTCYDWPTENPDEVKPEDDLSDHEDVSYFYMGEDQ